MRALLAATLGLAALFAAGRSHAQETPEGFPDPGESLLDTDFRVGTREFGLDRRVEMFQWRASDEGYQRVWQDGLIDSSGFAPGHANPARLPLESRRWWAAQPTLDGKPLDPAVLRRLGEWRELHPHFSRLPANLAASFQPEGDGLGSAENPLDPHIGDLRISWRELVLPPLDGLVELRGGVWRLAAEPDDDVDAGPAAAPAARSAPAKSGEKRWPLFGGGFITVLLVVLAARRRKARRRDPSA